MTTDKLDDLYYELKQVKKSQDNYLPDYDYAPKEGVIKMIEKEIDLEENGAEIIEDEDDGMDYRNLCQVLGLSYY